MRVTWTFSRSEALSETRVGCCATSPFVPPRFLSTTLSSKADKLLELLPGKARLLKFMDLDLQHQVPPNRDVCTNLPLVRDLLLVRDALRTVHSALDARWLAAFAVGGFFGPLQDHGAFCWHVR